MIPASLVADAYPLFLETTLFLASTLPPLRFIVIDNNEATSVGSSQIVNSCTSSWRSQSEVNVDLSAFCSENECYDRLASNL